MTNTLEICFLKYACIFVAVECIVVELQYLFVSSYFMKWFVFFKDSCCINLQLTLLSSFTQVGKESQMHIQNLHQLWVNPPPPPLSPNSTITRFVTWCCKISPIVWLVGKIFPEDSTLSVTLRSAIQNCHINTPACDDAPDFYHIWLEKVQMFRRCGGNSYFWGFLDFHLNFEDFWIWILTVTLTLRTAIQNCHATLWLMMHQYIKFGCKGFKHSGDMEEMVISWGFDPILWP